jgi:hypothetical protein
MMIIKQVFNQVFIIQMPKEGQHHARFCEE